MRIFVMAIMLILSGLSMAYAVTINLTDGRSVQGDIIKQGPKSVEINVDGVTMTYYADEIKDIDGKSLSDQAAQPQAAQPQVTQPEVAAQPQPTTAPEAAPVQDQAASNPAPEAPVVASSTIDPDKRALILKFIEVFGTRQALSNNFELMVKQIEKEKPDEAQKIRDRVKVDEIIERLLPIYDRNFSSEDFKAFIDFYGSNEGQKLISTIPELMKESVQESVKYMEEKFPEVKQGS